MAIHSFYISIAITEDEKSVILEKVKLEKYKKTGDLVYKDVLFIDNITVEDSWWHINVGLYDLFHSCEVLYEFCQVVSNEKPKFEFILLGKPYCFSFHSLLDFITFLYPKIEKYKKLFEERFGTLSVHPQNFFSFRRKNERFFK